jgi:hypothetical protein
MAQVYVSFISTSDSSDTWMDVNSCTDFNCYNTFTNRYTIEGDTLIANIQYAKIFVKTKHQQGSDQSTWCTESTTYDYHYFGAIRENGKKIYVIPDFFNPIEYLAYDFNLTIGDTMPSPDGNSSVNPSNQIIHSIDSVLVYGSYRKRYLVNSTKFVIEGIGASTGLFNPLDFQASYCNMQMLCYSENDIPDYFLINCAMNLSVSTITAHETQRQLLKIVDYFGRETEYQPNTPLIYLYNDGTTEKVFKID